MAELIRVSAVEYLNTAPFVVGLSEYRKQLNIDLRLDHPAECARKMLHGDADLGLIPVAEISKLKNPQLIDGYCIGAVGAVRTVCLFGNVPVEEMTRVITDPHSRTSVELLRILTTEYWSVNMPFETGVPGYEQHDLKTPNGILAIGDKVFAIEHKYKYRYDLSEVWQNLTGLPFIFAAWIANVKLSQAFLSEFNEALEYGLSRIDQIAKNYPLTINLSHEDLKDYLQNNISFILDENKKKGLDLFLEKMAGRTF